jgi:hypothetical protein
LCHVCRTGNAEYPYKRPPLEEQTTNATEPPPTKRQRITVEQADEDIAGKNWNYETKPSYSDFDLIVLAKPNNKSELDKSVCRKLFKP